MVKLFSLFEMIETLQNRDVDLYFTKTSIIDIRY